MVLVLFAVITVVLQVANVFLCLALDEIFSPTVGALTFVILYFTIFGVAWLVSVRVAERWEAQARPQRDTQPEENWDRPAQATGR